MTFKLTFMKALLISFFIILFCCKANYYEVQEDKSVKSNKIDLYNQEDSCNYYYDTLVSRRVYTKVTKQPEFPKGKQELYRFIISKVKISEDEFIESHGKVITQFIVSENGKILNVSVPNKEKVAYSSLEKSIIQILNKMPDWQPGMCGDSIVSTLYKLPIVF